MRLYILRKYGALFILIGVFILARILTTGFFNMFNLSIILTMSSILGFLALGETLVIFTRGFDLSVGNVASMSTVIITAIMLHSHENLHPSLVIISAILVALMGGALIGTINGLAVVFMKIPPFIATMGGMWIAYGVAFLILRGVPTKLQITSIKILGSGKIFFFTIPFLTLIIVMGILYFLLKNTSLGVRIYSSGGNDYAAYLSGIKVGRVRLLVCCCGAWWSVSLRWCGEYMGSPCRCNNLADP